MTGASNLELCLGISLSDLHQSSIASAGLLQKVTDICNLLWHLEILWTNALLNLQDNRKKLRERVHVYREYPAITKEQQSSSKRL
mmetsp:Transcript_33637/g.56264  ORF Transcript_33637/g.56264 Transcript_33637/m.56264 type:complete len:85 (-) Transcript_33637:258-512(-)